jgi:hypothetical protein
MKVSRNQLKSVVKECLMEILAEGLLHGEGVIPQKRPKKNMVVNEAHAPEVDRFDKAVTRTVGNLTNDSIMSSILADTAKTTYQEQLSAEKAPGNPRSRVNESSAELGEVFGEQADRWASLAFPEKK